MSVMAVGCWFLYDALFSVGYLGLFSGLVMCYGDRVRGHLSDMCPVHIVASGTFKKKIKNGDRHPNMHSKHSTR
jgi:hypothetical protein